MYKYIYKNLKTGEKIYLNRELNNKDFELIFEIKNVDMKPKEINQK